MFSGCELFVVKKLVHEMFVLKLSGIQNKNIFSLLLEFSKYIVVEIWIKNINMNNDSLMSSTAIRILVKKILKLFIHFRNLSYMYM